MYSLKIKEDTLNELHNYLTLCYTGNQHQSTDQQGLLERKFKDDSSRMIERLKRIKENAKITKEYLLSPTPNFPGIGEILHQSWLEKREISPAVTNEKIDTLYKIGIEKGAYGGKLLGSGGGGYILFFHPPEKRNILERTLTEQGGEILNFNFSSQGAVTWTENQEY
jgi:D-glycero-alpha-D-manno-heptose-7-phosphate kinase